MDNLNKSFFTSLNFCAAESFLGRKKSAVNPQKIVMAWIEYSWSSNQHERTSIFGYLVMALPPKDLIVDMTPAEPPETSGNFQLTVNVLSWRCFSTFAPFTPGARKATG